MLRAFWLIKVQSLKAALQYPANFILDVLGVGLNGFAEVLVILLLTTAFQSIGGWSFWQVGFMAGLWRLSHSLHHLLFLGFMEHRWLVRDGELDIILVRPAPPLIQILARGLPLEAIGELLPAVTLFILTAGHVQVSWTIGNILFLDVVIASGAVIEWAAYLFWATFNFWSTDNDLLWVANSFLFPTARYPIHIYGRVFISILTFVFPYGFMAYYPVHHFFGIAPDGFSTQIVYLSPLVAVIMLLIGLGFWSLGLRHYQSTGT